MDVGAIPLMSGLAVVEFVPPKLALAPLAGAVNVTATPESGFDNESVTFALSVLPNAVPTNVLCGVPLTITTEFVAPATLVKSNVAVAPTPATDPITL